MMPDYTYEFEIKSLDEDGEGTFSGVAAVMEVEDLGGDVIERGAFKRTLAENRTVPVLWQHDSSEVIGQGVVSEWQNKLLIKGSLDMDDPVAVRAWKKAKRGFVKGLSIGFQALRAGPEEIEGRIIRKIKELKLYEVSLVTFPMMPSAQVTRVKAADEFIQRLANLEEKVSTLQAAIESRTQATSQLSEPGRGADGQAQNIDPADSHSKFTAKADEIRRLLGGH